jgi:hypothetical protein
MKGSSRTHRLRFPLLALAAVGVVGELGLAQGREAGVRSFHIQGNVWMIDGGSVNAAVSIGEDGVLVVDTLAEPLVDWLLGEIQALA